MPERTSYKPGAPCWIDLGTPDQDAAGEFYGALFGWQLEADENAEQTGGYRTANLGDRAIGGVMKLMQEGQPPAWMTYFASRGRRRDRGEGPRGRRKHDRRADGRSRLRPHGDPRRSDRRGLRRLAGRPQRRRRADRRAERDGLERAHDPRPGRRRPSTARSSAGASRRESSTAAPTRSSSSTARASAASPIEARRTCRPIGSSTSPSRMPTRRCPRRRSGVGRRPSARSTSRKSAESPCSGTRGVRSSP